MEVVMINETFNGTTRLPIACQVSGEIAELKFANGQCVKYHRLDGFSGDVEETIEWTDPHLAIHDNDRNAPLKDVYDIALRVIGISHTDFKKMLKTDWNHAVLILEFMQGMFTVHEFLDARYLDYKGHRDDDLLEPIFNDWRNLPIAWRNSEHMYYVMPEDTDNPYFRKHMMAKAV